MLRIRRCTNGSAAQRAGNATQRSPDHHPHGPGHCDADDRASGQTGNRSTTRQRRIGFAPGFTRLHRELRGRIRILRGNAVPGMRLFCQVFVFGRSVGRLAIGCVHGSLQVNGRSDGAGGSRNDRLIYLTTAKAGSSVRVRTDTADCL